jgi:hypothetical protein
MSRTFGVGHQGAAHRHHLLLPAGEGAGLLLQALADPGERFEHGLAGGLDR